MRSKKLQIIQHVSEGIVHISSPEFSSSTASPSHGTLSVGPSINPESSHPDGDVRLPKSPVIDGLLVHNAKPRKENPLTDYMIYSPDIERHIVPSGVLPEVNQTDSLLRFKMKLIGETHWMNLMMRFDRIMGFFFELQRGKHSEESSELKVLLLQCKELGRAIKSERPLTYLTVSNINTTIPSKSICDDYIGNYLNTIESIYRVVHIPSFLRKYHNHWNTGLGIVSHTLFTTQLLLVLAIGSILQSDSSGHLTVCSTARNWIYTAQQWLSVPLEKSRMNITGIQIQCLLIIAREAAGIGSDLLWISAGSLLRSAIQLGYHRDPKHYPGMSTLHAEMRRRLWATIMELGVKESLSTAMPPLITMNDFDTEPPANIDDNDIIQDTRSAPISQDLSNITQTSLQIIMLQSLRVKLELASITTNFRCDLSYEEVLRLHSEITSACRKAQSIGITSDNPSLTSFQYNYFNLTIRRPLLALHSPWAAKARTDPRFYFSRKVCLDACLTILSPSTSADYSHLLTIGNGAWLEIGSLNPLAITFELIMQLEEESLNPSSTLQTTRAKATREPLIQILRDAAALKLERLEAGEINVKGYLVLCMTLAQIEAIERGENVEKGIADAAMNSLRKSHEILKDRVSKIPNVSTQSLILPSWDNEDYEAMNEGFDLDGFMDAGFSFDMIDTVPMESCDGFF